MPKLTIRQGQWLDQALLRDMDLKCFDEPWEASYWLYWFNESRVVLVVEVDGKPAGFAVGELNEDGLVIEKLGVKKPYRRMGVSRMLLDGCDDLTVQCPEKPKIYLIIPEPWLYDDSPDCVAEWMKAMKIRARLPYLPGYFCINEVEIDGIRCELEVEDQS